VWPEILLVSYSFDMMNRPYHNSLLEVKKDIDGKACSSSSNSSDSTFPVTKSQVGIDRRRLVLKADTLTFRPNFVRVAKRLWTECWSFHLPKHHCKISSLAKAFLSKKQKEVPKLLAQGILFCLNRFI